MFEFRLCKFTQHSIRNDTVAALCAYVCQGFVVSSLVTVPMWLPKCRGKHIYRPTLHRLALCRIENYPPFLTRRRLSDDWNFMRSTPGVSAGVYRTTTTTTSWL